MRQPWMRVFSILLGCIAFLMPSSAFAGLCEEQLEIPWRSSAVRRIIPLNRPFRLLPDGTEGAGRVHGRPDAGREPGGAGQVGIGQVGAHQVHRGAADV